MSVKAILRAASLAPVQTGSWIQEENLSGPSLYCQLVTSSVTASLFCGATGGKPGAPGAKTGDERGSSFFRGFRAKFATTWVGFDLMKVGKTEG